MGMEFQLQIALQLLLAVLLGGVVGLEREYTGKEAGFRTYALVCLGAAFFTIISTSGFNSFLGVPGVSFDPSRVVGQIVLGVGFLGAGLIVYRDLRIEGLTTAAGIWVVAAIGVAVGVRFYFAAIFVAFLAVAILAGFRAMEEKVFRSKKV